MLQNRVDPWGNIIQTSARGSWMGNRGVLHGDHQDLLRPFRLKAWLICLLEFKGRKRPVMAPRNYTELFFLDEATAFSAGHRPCGECRRMDFIRFKSLWLEGNPEYPFTERTSIREIDEVLHRERINGLGEKIVYEERTGEIPNGAFVLHESTAFLMAKPFMRPWTPFGYGEGVAIPAAEMLRVLTPRSVVNTFRAGYTAQVRTGGGLEKV